LAILKVAHMGHPCLREVSSAVAPDRIRSKAFQQFCDDLYETMLETDGVGLAAPQVHVNERVVVFQLDEESGPMWLVNPVLTPVGEEKKSGYEGCLSVPGLRGSVARHVTIEVRALDRNGKPLAFRATDYAARVVQHECDHLDAVLYVDRVDTRSLAFLPEYRKHGPLVPSDDDSDDDADGALDDAE
jgi:peptide deformylase